MELALGLVIGALSHYRFVGVIGVGAIALLLIPQGRRMLRDPQVWVALALGMVAWLPLLAWNADNGEAGLKFQLVDRHPWSFQPAGIAFLLIQLLLVTPLLAVAMTKVALMATARRQQRLARAVALPSACSVACPRWASSCSGSSPTPSGSVSTGRCRAIWRC